MHSVLRFVRPAQKSRAILFDLVTITLCSFLLGLVSQFKFPLWFTPVPITLQLLTVLMIGALLGSKRAGASLALYLFEGVVGLPVFSGGGFGILHLFGPTGGYLVGFLLAAPLIGYYLEQRKGKVGIFSATLACSAATTLVFLTGALWLSYFVGGSQAIAIGVIPFLAGSALQVLSGGALISAIKR